MKTTYLANVEKADGTSELTVISAQEWYDIVRSNQGLPADKRRYFITDCIEDGKTIDKMIIEVPYAYYHKHASEDKARRRNLLARNDFTLIYFDADTAGIELSSCNYDDSHMLDSALMNSLRNALAEWRPWAVEMLEMYLSGWKKCCNDTPGENIRSQFKQYASTNDISRSLLHLFFYNNTTKN